jgi:hypothetical protein
MGIVPRWTGVVRSLPTAHEEREKAPELHVDIQGLLSVVPSSSVANGEYDGGKPSALPLITNSNESTTLDDLRRSRCIVRQ